MINSCIWIALCAFCCARDFFFYKLQNLFCCIRNFGTIFIIYVAIVDEPTNIIAKFRKIVVIRCFSSNLYQVNWVDDLSICSNESYLLQWFKLQWINSLYYIPISSNRKKFEKNLNTYQLICIYEMHYIRNHWDMLASEKCRNIHLV